MQEVKRGPFRETLRCGGEIYASQSELSVVSAPIAGVVTFVDGRVMTNSTVSAGQGLFRLSSGSFLQPAETFRESGPGSSRS